MPDALILNLVLFLPALAATALIWVPNEREDAIRGIAFWTMAAQLALAAWLYAQFDPANPDLQFATRLPWIPGWGVQYLVGLDGYNVLLVLLTAFLGLSLIHI